MIIALTSKANLQKILLDEFVSSEILINRKCPQFLLVFFSFENGIGFQITSDKEEKFFFQNFTWVINKEESDYLETELNFYCGHVKLTSRAHLMNFRRYFSYYLNLFILYYYFFKLKLMQWRMLTIKHHHRKNIFFIPDISNFSKLDESF